MSGLPESFAARVGRVSGVHTDWLGFYLTCLPAEERRAAIDSLTAICDAFDAGCPMDGTAAMRFLLDQIRARARTEYRKRSNRKTDTKRRITVGCKVSYRLHAKCQAIAEERGLSLNAWVKELLEDQVRGRRWEYLDAADEVHEDYDPLYGWRRR